MYLEDSMKKPATLGETFVKTTIIDHIESAMERNGDINLMVSTEASW